MSHEFLTDEQLERVFALIRLPRERATLALEAQPPAGELPQSWEVAELGLRIRLEEAAGVVRLRLSGGEEWRGVLVCCRWDWYDIRQPQRDVPESLTAFILMPDTAFNGHYVREAYIPERVTFCPAVARVVPKYADPEQFLKRWREAQVKPPIDELKEWLQANKDNFAPRHSERWQAILGQMQAI